MADVTGERGGANGASEADLPTASYGPDFHRTLVDNLAVGVYFVDPERTITYWNRGAERLTGYAAGDVVGRSCYDNLLAHVDAEGTPLCINGCPLAGTIADGREREQEVWLRHRDGQRRPVRVRAAPIRDADGAIVGAVEVFEDDSPARSARAEADAALHDSLTDPLTGLANRRRLAAALAGSLDNLRRHGWMFGVLIADIDHFKAVNDEFGHPAGDATLRSVAASLEGGTRAGDTVGRWGGEEFLVVVIATDGAGLKRTAERLRILVESSAVRIGESYVPLTISLGGTLARAADSPEDLVARADRALYEAKQAGRNRVTLAD